MKDTVRRLLGIHAVVLGLSAAAAWVLWNTMAVPSAAVGALAFSVPVLAFGFLVVRASRGESSRFLGRFMLAEVLKWVSGAGFLALAFASSLFQPKPLLMGFLLSVAVQVVFPIFVRRESAS